MNPTPLKISFREVAQPESRLPLVNCPRVFMEKERLLATVNYSSDGRDTRLFLSNVDSLETEAIPVPDQQFQVYGFAQGADGRLYLGCSGGRIYSYDPTTKKFQLVADPFPQGNRLTWGACASRAGRVYMGVYPTGAFTEYDIATGTHTVLSSLPEQTKGVYARDFLEMPDGRILLILMGAAPELIIYNPSTREFDLRKKITSKDAEIAGVGGLAVLDKDRVIYAASTTVKTFNTARGEWEDDFLTPVPEVLCWMAWIGETLFAAGAESGALYIVTRQGCTPVETGLYSGNRFAGRIDQVGPDRFIGLGDNGLLTRFSLHGEAPETRQIDTLTSRGLNLHFLKKDLESPVVIGSHFINSQIFRLNLESGQCQPSLDKITSTAGQVTCASFLDGVAYLGIYGQAILQAYHPGEPFAYGKNPRFLIKIGSEQNRPIGLANDGHRLFMATRAYYGVLGGAISEIDPKNGRCEVYRDFVPTQNPVSMFYHDGCLIGTTEIRGDQGSCLPQAENAVIYVWDTRIRQTRQTKVPWKAESLHGLALSPNGQLIGFEPNKYFLYDSASGDCAICDWSYGTAHSGIFLDDRRCLIAVPGKTPGKHTLLLLDITEKTTSSLGEIEPIRLFERLGSGEILVGLAGYRVAVLTLTPTS